MRKLQGLKKTFYADHLNDLSKYLDLFPGDTLSDKIGVTGLKEFLLNIMPNRWSTQACVQGFYCEYILF